MLYLALFFIFLNFPIFGLHIFECPGVTYSVQFSGACQGKKIYCLCCIDFSWCTCYIFVCHIYITDWFCSCKLASVPLPPSHNKQCWLLLVPSLTKHWMLACVSLVLWGSKEEKLFNHPMALCLISQTYSLKSWLTRWLTPGSSFLVLVFSSAPSFLDLQAQWVLRFQFQFASA